MAGTTMTEKLREQISALADNELTEGEHELLMRRFGTEKHLCLCWERYYLIGEAMRKTLSQADTAGFADRVMAAVGQDPVAAAQEHDGLFGYLGKSIAGLAVAVCVAVVAIVGLRYDSIHVQPASAPSEIVPSSSPIRATPVAYGMASNASWNGNTPEVQAELNNYVINHGEIAAALGQQGMPPYFYITAYTVPEQTQNPPRTFRQAKHRDRR